MSVAVVVVLHPSFIDLGCANTPFFSGTWVTLSLGGGGGEIGLYCKESLCF